MGLFDFLKSSSSDSQDQGPTADYVFAHYALRAFALQQPLQFLSTASGPNAETMIAELIDEVKTQCGKPTTFGADELTVHVHRIKKFPGIVVEFPDPRELAEAHMVGLIVEINLDLQAVPADPAQVAGRYFTLEKSITLSNEPRTVLGEWTLSDHSNLGEGPNPTVSDFVEAITKFV